jgi:SAM-dependent methyltransferase
MHDYASLEPGQGDAWNPVAAEPEVVHRVALFRAVVSALRASGRPMEALRVLDVGCGTGRSSRMYVDLGIDPGNIHGIDVRPNAVEAARRLHPGIQFSVPPPSDSLCTGSRSNWVHVSTVFSSVPTAHYRKTLAKRILDTLPAGGLVFYFDRLKANEFAGGDALSAATLFPGLEPLYRQSFITWRLRQELAPRDVSRLKLAYCRLKDALGLLAPTHEAVLLRK